MYRSTRPTFPGVHTYRSTHTTLVVLDANCLSTLSPLSSQKDYLSFRMRHVPHPTPNLSRHRPTSCSTTVFITNSRGHTHTHTYKRTQDLDEGENFETSRVSLESEATLGSRDYDRSMAPEVKTRQNFVVSNGYVRGTSESTCQSRDHIPPLGKYEGKTGSPYTPNDPLVGYKSLTKDT